jgi:hypothetical protein
MAEVLEPPSVVADELLPPALDESLAASLVAPPSESRPAPVEEQATHNNIKPK